MDNDFSAATVPLRTGLRHTTTEITRHGNTVTATTTFTPKRSYQPMGSRGGGYKLMGGSGGYKPMGR